MNLLIAQQPHNIGSPITGFGPLGNPGDSGPTLLSQLISGTIGLLTVVAFVWFLFTLMAGALGIITAGGDKGALEGARKKITMGAVGILVVVAGMFIMDFVANLLGIPSILNLESVINRITPKIPPK